MAIYQFIHKLHDNDSSACHKFILELFSVFALLF